MKQPLPFRLASNVVYDAVEVEQVSYDPLTKQYSARVFGVCGEHIMPLIFVTRRQLRRIEEVVITDDEIDQVIAAHPEYANERVPAAMYRAFERLAAMAAEPTLPPLDPETPHA